ncbi:hypothetical protein DWB85_01190 [Seongchinamella sediminis]|uniref:EthD domain-containing protein n=1 Tax=Seongchinamella sediminis TaxID=2283635 RepID=A0A3L7E1L4_9GAMM|nr:hypothetical protein [Seongchinamella sediminis]RLQ23797.1 hypothetical protein DWB85_01190 [Seongchinamella sediminis]
MEKLIYPLWKAEAADSDGFRDQLLASLRQLAPNPAIRGLRLAVSDSAVAAGAQRRMAATRPLPDAVLSVWLDAAAGQRGDIEASLVDPVSRHHCYLVTEAEPLLNRSQQPGNDDRVPGMCQVVFLQRPPRLSESEWLSIWQDSHTQVAIDTQSTFGYRQNVIVRGLSYAAPPLNAMIEENFPEAAITCNHAFYGVAEDDDEGLARNAQTMMESVARFIDFDRIDVIPMSEYLLKPLA